MPRHRTLRAVVEWSWDLLDDAGAAARRAARGLPGGRDRRAREPSARASRSATGRRDRPARRARRQVVAAARRRDGRPRYRMLETIREYGIERLAERGASWRRSRQAHARYFADLATEAEPHLRSRDQLPWLAGCSGRARQRPGGPALPRRRRRRATPPADRRRAAVVLDDRRAATPRRRPGSLRARGPGRGRSGCDGDRRRRPRSGHSDAGPTPRRIDPLTAAGRRRWTGLERRGPRSAHPLGAVLRRAGDVRPRADATPGATSAAQPGPVGRAPRHGCSRAASPRTTATSRACAAAPGRGARARSGASASAGGWRTTLSSSGCGSLDGDLDGAERALEQTRRADGRDRVARTTAMMRLRLADAARPARRPRRGRACWRPTSRARTLSPRSAMLKVSLALVTPARGDVGSRRGELGARGAARAGRVRARRPEQATRPRRWCATALARSTDRRPTRSAQAQSLLPRGLRGGAWHPRTCRSSRWSGVPSRRWRVQLGRRDGAARVLGAAAALRGAEDRDRPRDRAADRRAARLGDGGFATLRRAAGR